MSVKKVVKDRKHIRFTTYTQKGGRGAHQSRVADFRGRGAKGRAGKLSRILLQRGALSVTIKYDKNTHHYRLYASYPTGKQTEILKKSKTKFNKWERERK